LKAISGYPPRDVPEMTAGRAALVSLLDRFLFALLDPFVTSREAHKLLYFMQVAGEPLRLSFRKGPDGPYAENLPPVLNAIEGHFVSGYAEGGDAPDRQLQLVPGALEEARGFLANNTETQARLDRVFDLVDGFESGFGLELLTTVHWVAAHEATAAEPDEIVRLTYEWSQRKKQFSQRQIELAVRVLSDKGWMSPASVEFSS